MLSRTLLPRKQRTGPEFSRSFGRLWQCRRWRAFPVIGALLWCVSSSVAALGFGRYDGMATLGQPLDFRIALRQESDEFVDAECVSGSVVVGDRRLQPQMVNFGIEGAANAAQRTLRIRSSALIDEPFVTVTVAVGCPPRLSREFVLLADPPFVNLATQSPASPAPAVAPAPAAEPAPVAAARSRPRSADEASVGATTRPQRRRGPRADTAAPTRPGEPSVAAGPQPRRSAAPRAVPAATPAAPARDRLQLDPATAVTRAATEAAVASAPAAPPPQPQTVEAPATQASAVAPAQPRAEDVDRLAKLEAALARLQAETSGTSDELTTLRARLQRAEAARFSNPLVYGLVVLSALLALLLGLTLIRRSREREARWWAAAQAQSSSVATPVSSYHDSGPPSESVPAPSSVGDLDEAVAPRTAAPALAPETRSAIEEPRREVSVEELIDLEQQAEFFVVLGQDESAIDLLMNHLRNTGGISPLPYLKLLDIYRRRGDRDAYERMRERFNRRFNAYAPDWESDPSHGRSLESYPEIMQQLQDLWPQPRRAMEKLESMLFRRDAGETFDVPAYSEVLFLYSLARDLSEHAAPQMPRSVDPVAHVDLLLPFGDESDAGSIVAQPMTSTISMVSNPAVDKPLSLDLDVTGAEHRSSRHDPGDFSFDTGHGDTLRPDKKT